MDNFVKQCLSNGGYVAPLLIPPQSMEGPSLTNPSILCMNDKILVNIRNVNYTLYHSELNKFEHKWGPLSYIHPENDQHLRTTNYILVLDALSLSTINYSKVDTSLFDKEPLWDFVGLEDARLIYWDKKLYLCGVRRDTTLNGVGRMELSEISMINNTFKEISRFRIPVPNEEEYCNKNWMPILSQPYRFIKWCNPLEIIETYPQYNKSAVIFNSNNYVQGYPDWRGSSQVISLKDNYLAIVHETDLYRTEIGNKDATYRHRFLLWDKDWNLFKVSKLFSFMNTKIEFCCGMDQSHNSILITFGIQDNAAFILKTPANFIENFIYE